MFTFNEYFFEHGKKRFCINGDIQYPIAAGGCIFYKCTTDAIYVLLQLIGNRYEDLGGKVEQTDNDIYDTVAREVNEETNNIICNVVDIKNRLLSAECIYIPNAKYMLFFLEATPHEMHIESTSFGEIETHTQIPRTVHWINACFLVQLKLSGRLPVNQILTKLFQMYLSKFRQNNIN